MNIKQAEAEHDLLKFPLAHRTSYGTFRLAHGDSAEEANADLAVWAIPVRTRDPLTT